MVVKVCTFCGKEFNIRASHADSRVHCGVECMRAHYKEQLQGTANPNYRDAARKVCVLCGAEYFAYDKNRRYCSMACRALAARKSDEEKIATRKAYEARRVRPRRPYKPGPPAPLKEYICRTCGKAFLSHHAQKECPECGWIIRTCIVCGAEFKQRSYHKKTTCSEECRRSAVSQRQKGDKSHYWQGGKTAETRLIRTRREYDEWRTTVYVRDDYTCQLCGERGGKLSAHHIKPFAKEPALRLDVANGITLCWPCHASIKSKEPEYEARFLAITMPASREI